MTKSYQYKTGDTLNTVCHVLENGNTKCRVEFNDHSTDIEFYCTPEKPIYEELKELKPLINSSEIFAQQVAPCLAEMLSCKFGEFVYVENHYYAQNMFPLEVGKYDTPTRWQITVCDKWIRLTHNHKKVTTIRQEIRPCTQLELNNIKFLLKEIENYLTGAF